MKKLWKQGLVIFVAVLAILIAAISQYEFYTVNTKLTQMDNVNNGLKQHNQNLELQIAKLSKDNTSIKKQLEQTKKTDQATIDALKKKFKQQQLIKQEKAHQINQSATLSSRSGGVLTGVHFSNWMSFRASFYNTSGITTSGRYTSSSTIAVDPSVIPLGSIVEIQFPDGHTEERRADDTGGAIYGNRIDVYENASTNTILNMGVQYVELRVITTSK